MSRRNRKYPNHWKADSKYSNMLVGRFVGHILQDGKRSIAEKIVYDAFDIIHEKTKKGGLNVFEQAIKNVSPLLAVKSRRIGGANYQVPIQVSGDARQTLAMCWIKDACNSKKGSSMANKLADELVDASTKVGTAMKKREDTHRMAESNRAFAHFA
ncbi:30S ribosomal protein S7 [Patescibacteria group bacterium]